MADATCIVTDCQAPQNTRGYCRAHYLKVHRYGTPDARRSSDQNPTRPTPLTTTAWVKNCAHCGVEYADGRRKYCSKACAEAAANQTPSVKYHRLSDVNTDAMTATCSQCGPTQLWASNRGTTYGQIRCISGRRRDYLRRLTAKYGLTEQQVTDLEAEANGHCMICNKPNAHLVVDHDHTTKHVRGLICDPCNVLLGRANDDIGTLLNAVQYLVDRGTPARMAMSPRGYQKIQA